MWYKWRFSKHSINLNEVIEELSNPTVVKIFFSSFSATVARVYRFQVPKINESSSLQSQMGDLKTYKQHFESKHSKLPLPDALKELA